MSEQIVSQKLPAVSQIPNDRSVGNTVMMPTQVRADENEGLPLREYWFMLQKRRWTIISVLLMTLFTVAVGTLKQRPVYRAKTVIQIDRESQDWDMRRGGSEDAAVTEDEAYLETQYKILQSRALAADVIERMHLDRYPDFGGSPAKAAGNASSARSAADMQDVINAFLGNLSITPIRRSRLVEAYFESYDPQLAARVTNTFATAYIERNLRVKLDSTQKASDMLGEQLTELKAKLERSEEQLQEYARLNSILLVDEKQTMTSEKLKQLQTEYTQAEADRMEKQPAYDQVRSGSTEGLPGVQENQTYQAMLLKLGDLKREYSEQSVTYGPDYPKMKKLRNQIDETEKALKGQRQLLAERLIADYRAAQTRAALLKTAFDAQTREFNSIAEKSIQYNILKREVDTNRQLYDGLLQRLKQASISAGLRASNIWVLDKAEVPKRPSRPRTGLNLALAAVIGLALGLGLAYLQEQIDRTLKTPDDVQRYLGLSTLAIIPASNSRRGGGYGYGYGRSYGGYGYGYGGMTYGHKSLSRQTASAEKSPVPGGKQGALVGQAGSEIISEAYRSLRTSVLLSSGAAPPRVLLVTSGQPGEGKTTTAVNLALTLAQLGSRVLIIDSDMRKPRVATILKLERNDKGLSTLLAGSTGLDESVQPTHSPTLTALPCGPIPPNPAELLSSSTMRELIAEARNKYDYVLLDSPPVINVSDSRVLSSLVDAVALVAFGGVTPREVVLHARDHLLSSNANIIGVVLNNVDFSSSYDYYYRYYRGYRRRGYGQGYGYGYGYGYGETPAGETKPDSEKAQAHGGGSVA